MLVEDYYLVQIKKPRGIPARGFLFVIGREVSARIRNYEVRSPDEIIG